LPSRSSAAELLQIRARGCVFFCRTIRTLWEVASVQRGCAADGATTTHAYGEDGRWMSATNAVSTDIVKFDERAAR
jgi:hypothetical protein